MGQSSDENHFSYNVPLQRQTGKYIKTKDKVTFPNGVVVL